MIMVGKCDASPNGDFCNVSLSRLLWFTGLFSVMTTKDDNQNEIDLTQSVGQKKKKKKNTNLPPRATRKNKEKRRENRLEQLQGVNTNLTAMSGSNKNDPLPALDLHQQGSPALRTLLAHVRAPGGQIGISWRIIFVAFFTWTTLSSRTPRRHGGTPQNN